MTFHYNTQDYLGNNRAVINGSTGAIEQTVAYYPFGAVIADLGTPTTGQPYKFGGKELITHLSSKQDTHILLLRYQCDYNILS